MNPRHVIYHWQYYSTKYKWIMLFQNSHDEKQCSLLSSFGQTWNCPSRRCNCKNRKCHLKILLCKMLERTCSAKVALRFNNHIFRRTCILGNSLKIISENIKSWWLILYKSTLCQHFKLTTMSPSIYYCTSLSSSCWVSVLVQWCR